MTRERRFSLVGAAALLVTLPLVAGAQTTPATPKVFFACYGSLTGVVYRVKEPGLPNGCLHRTHVEFSWTSGTGGAALTDHGALQGLGDDDHPQYLPVDGSRALTGGLSVGGVLSVGKITNLVEATAAGEAVPYEQAVKSGDPAGGDLSGTYPAPTVAKLQNTAVSTTAPASGQVLAFDGQAWKPTAVSTGGSSISGWQRITQTATVPANSAGALAIRANCPAGKRVLGGGAEVLWDNMSQALAMRITVSVPSFNGDYWFIEALNTGPIAKDVVAFAVCANATP